MTFLYIEGFASTVVFSARGRYVLYENACEAWKHAKSIKKRATITHHFNKAYIDKARPSLNRTVLYIENPSI